MELWLLGAGAVVLIAITLWIVWPGRIEEAVDDAEPAEAAPSPGERLPAAVPKPASTSLGSIVQVGPPMPSAANTASQPQPRPVPSPPRQMAPAEAPSWSPGSPPSGSLAEKSRFGVVAGVLLALGSAITGAWLYARWQRARNKPISRLKRGAQQLERPRWPRRG